MKEMLFIKEYLDEEVTRRVNEALAVGFEYVDSQCSGPGGSSYVYILVVMSRDPYRQVDIKPSVC